jgi:hypothetical protein
VAGRDRCGDPVHVVHGQPSQWGWYGDCRVERTVGGSAGGGRRCRQCGGGLIPGLYRSLSNHRSTHGWDPGARYAVSAVSANGTIFLGLWGPSAPSCRRRCCRVGVSLDDVIGRGGPARAAISSLLLVLVAGCGNLGSAENANAADAALAFERTLSNPSRACQLLAPGTLSELQDSFGPCSRSLPPRHLPTATSVMSVDVYGKDALVHLDDDWVFLARFDQGWLVTAAGCVPVSDRPFDCKVKGQ